MSGTKKSVCMRERERAREKGGKREKGSERVHESGRGRGEECESERERKREKARERERDKVLGAENRKMDKLWKWGSSFWVNGHSEPVACPSHVWSERWCILQCIFPFTRQCISSAISQEHISGQNIAPLGLKTDLEMSTTNNYLTTMCSTANQFRHRQTTSVPHPEQTQVSSCPSSVSTSPHYGDRPLLSVTGKKTSAAWTPPARSCSLHSPTLLSSLLLLCRLFGWAGLNAACHTD